MNVMGIKLFLCIHNQAKGSCHHVKLINRSIERNILVGASEPVCSLVKGGKSLIKTSVGAKISKISRLFIVNTSYITLQKLSMNTINKLSLSTTRYMKWHSISRLLESQTRGNVWSSLQTSLRLIKGRLKFNLGYRVGMRPI